MKSNKDQSDLAKSGIAVASPPNFHQTPRLYSPDGSMGLTVWPQFAIACFGWGFDPQISSSHKGQGLPTNITCHWTPEVYLPNGI